MLEEELKDVHDFKQGARVKEGYDAYPFIDFRHHLHGKRVVFGLDLCLEVRQKAISQQRNYEEDDTYDFSLLFALAVRLRIKYLENDDAYSDDDSHHNLLCLQLHFLILDSRAQCAHEDN